MNKKSFFIQERKLVFLVFFNGLLADDAQSSESPQTAKEWGGQEVYHNDSTTRINWYDRLKSRKEAANLYDSLVHLINTTKTLIDNFNLKKEEAVKQIDNFLLSVGVNYGGAQQLVNNLLSLTTEIESVLSELEELHGNDIENLSKKEKSEITNFHNQIDNLKLHIEDIGKNIGIFQSAHPALTRAMAILSEQDKKLQAYEQKAWADYQKLDELVSDKQAEELSKNIKNYFKNAELIKNYVQGTFLQYFNSVLSEINKGSRAISQELDSIEKEMRTVRTQIQENLDLIKNKKQEIEEAEQQKLLAEQERQRRVQLEKERLALENAKPWYEKTLSSLEKYIIPIKETFVDTYSFISQKFFSLFSNVDGTSKKLEKKIENPIQSSILAIEKNHDVAKKTNDVKLEIVQHPIKKELPVQTFQVPKMEEEHEQTVDNTPDKLVKPEKQKSEKAKKNFIEPASISSGNPYAEPEKSVVSEEESHEEAGEITVLGSKEEEGHSQEEYPTEVQEEEYHENEFKQEMPESSQPEKNQDLEKEIRDELGMQDTERTSSDDESSTLNDIVNAPREHGDFGVKQMNSAFAVSASDHSATQDSDHESNDGKNADAKNHHSVNQSHHQDTHISHSHHEAAPNSSHHTSSTQHQQATDQSHVNTQNHSANTSNSSAHQSP